MQTVKISKTNFSKRKNNAIGLTRTALTSGSRSVETIWKLYKTIDIRCVFFDSTFVPNLYQRFLPRRRVHRCKWCVPWKSRLSTKIPSSCRTIQLRMQIKIFRVEFGDTKFRIWAQKSSYERCSDIIFFNLKSIWARFEIDKNRLVKLKNQPC